MKLTTTFEMKRTARTTPSGDDFFFLEPRDLASLTFYARASGNGVFVFPDPQTPHQQFGKLTR